MTEVLVRGHAEGRIVPDRAGFSVTVTGRDPRSAEAALARGAELAAVLDAEVERRRAGESPLVRAVVVASMLVSEQYEYRGNQRQLVGYAAARTTEIECAADAEGLTDIVAVMARNGIRLNGPAWEVDPLNPGWDGLRTAAVTDARHRAEVYAAAAGHRLGVVRWIAEPGLRVAGSPGYSGGVAEARMMARAVGGGEDEVPTAVRIAVEPVAVALDVEMAFDLA